MFSKLLELIFGEWETEKSFPVNKVTRRTSSGEVISSEERIVVVQKNSFSNRRRAFLRNWKGDKEEALSVEYLKTYFSDEMDGLGDENSEFTV